MIWVPLSSFLQGRAIHHLQRGYPTIIWREKVEVRNKVWNEWSWFNGELEKKGGKWFKKGAISNSHRIREFWIIASMLELTSIYDEDDDNRLTKKKWSFILKIKCVPKARRGILGSTQDGCLDSPRCWRIGETICNIPILTLRVYWLQCKYCIHAMCVCPSVELKAKAPLEDVQVLFKMKVFDILIIHVLLSHATL